jgi:hypothetical protein
MASGNLWIHSEKKDSSKNFGILGKHLGKYGNKQKAGPKNACLSLYLP